MIRIVTAQSFNLFKEIVIDSVEKAKEVRALTLSVMPNDSLEGVCGDRQASEMYDCDWWVQYWKY